MRLRGRARSRPAPRALSLGEIAWASVLPCALVTVGAIVVAGPPLGRLFLEPTGETIYPGAAIRPEPVEHGRYLVALLGPALLALVLALGARRRVALPSAAARVAVAAGQLAAVAFVLLAILTPYALTADLLPVPHAPTKFFRPPTLLFAAAFTLLLAWGLRSRPLLARVARAAAERRATLVACGAVAVAFTADWMLRAVNLDSTVGNAFNLNLLEWELSEPFAILDGHTTLVDFHAVYSHLWSYVAALSMAAFGASLGTWTATMAVVSGLAMLAIFAVLRRLTRSALLALALYLPFVAIGWWVQGTAAEGTSIVGVFSIWPIRMAGPFLLAWLTARHLDGAAPRRRWPLFAVAGLVLVNNLEFGLGALAATLVASVLVAPRSWPRILRDAAVGLAGAAALVCALTLARAGALPRFDFAFEFPRLFGVQGWGLLPMPWFGPHLLLYGTFAGAIGLAAVRALRGDADRLLTGLLGWAGTFGLLAGTYYVGRSEAGTLLCLFPTWILALTLLFVAVVRDLAGQVRRPSLAQLAVLFGFGLALAALPNTPLPWLQLDRLARAAPTPLFEQPAATRFVAQRTDTGEQVAILALLGHRIAYDLGLHNVSPYSTVEAIRTPRQLAIAMDAIERAHVQHVFVRAPTATIGEDFGSLWVVYEALAAAGWREQAREAQLIAYAR